MRWLRAVLVTFVCALILETHAFHPDGVDHEADLLCHVCNASYYCLNGQQFDCPANSLAAVALADNIEECVCNPGYLREGDLCNLGQPPAWYMYGNRSFCVHTRETIAAGASGHADCVCVPGFAGLPAAEPVHCEACPADTFADVHNTSECVPCPAYASHNETRRANVTACLCDPGYTGPDGGPCVACAAGTFKAQPGAAACEDCGVNEYSYTAAAVCVACHGNSSSLPRSPGVDHCLCDPGFYPSEGLCSMCHAGRFKNTTANEPCQSCTGNTFASELGATACTSCLVSSPFSTANPSEGGVRCQCIAGYTQTELNLVTPECSACPPDTFQPSQGQTTCELCDTNARSPEASVTPLACLCNAGFADDSEHECLVCAGGTYKEAAADDEEDTELCNECPDNSFSIAQSGRLADCLCDPGFSGPDGGPCIACAPGKFKAANGSAACEDCPLHTYSDAPHSTACASCVDFMSSIGGITVHPGQNASASCVCDVSRGFTEIVLGGARACSACQVGTYATDNGCRNCSDGTYADERGLIECKKCPANMSSYDYPFVACQCHKGYKCDAANSFMTFKSNDTECLCDECPADTFKDYTGAALACDVCQANSESVPASTTQDMCLCKRGYRQDGPTVCVACAAGTYSDALDVLACSVCPADTYTPAALSPWDAPADCQACAVCNQATNPAFRDHYDAARAGVGCGLDQATDCQPCPASASLFLPTTESQRNKGVESCVCDAHFYGTKGTACAACPSNQIRPDFIDAATTLADCLCAPGFEPDPGAVNLCRQCPIGTYKTYPGDHTCTACPATLTTEQTGNANASACVCAPGFAFDGDRCNICPDNLYKIGFNLIQTCTACTANSFGAVGGTGPLDCTCLKGFEVYADTCKSCQTGKYKNSTVNLGKALAWAANMTLADEGLYLCSICPLNTATNNTASPVCDACAAGKTTDGRTGQVECVCDVGTEPGAGGACQTCRAGTYKAASTDKYANRACVNCSSCAANQQVATECNSTHNITCRACQANSWSSAGRTLLDPCFCNAGYELQGELCVACPVGKARQANANNSIRCEVCGPGFANTSTQSTCHPCSEICEDVPVPPPRFFVRHECNASRDVICQQCQTCPPGQYANNTCGVSYGNDRFDTQCSVCPADFYCPGGSVSQAALPCPVNARSLPGSHAITNCTCDPGFYRSGDLCVVCPLDAYCPRGVFQPIACPAPGRTFYEGSAVRLDCHCPRGYFRDPPGDEERFNCSLCTPDDYCFNNSLYNCSDALMESEPGSGFFDNCTCVNRYYNNGTRCEDCNVDFSCVGGRQHACPALEWTNRLTRQEACVCRPSLVRAGAECVPCADDFFCDGSDDREHPCPSSSLGRAATNVSECLCNVSFEVVHSNNVSEPHSCRECSPHYFKNSVGNTLCQRCTRCLPASDSVWTRIVCDAGYDAMCDSCTVCHDPAAADTPAEQWAGVDCQEFADTVCFNCTLCDYSEQWEKAPCAETRDRECSAIQRGRPCEVGQYAGNHSRTTDSQCLPCAMNDTLYEGQRLHFYTSAGRRYDDLTSCDIACRQYSRLRDVNNPALGCVSCETGNVLFKVFTQNDLACTFTCLEGYVRTEDDCVPAPLQPSVSNFWNHTLNVTHVRRVSSNAGAAFRFTISHTAHGSFAVVIGQAEPSCASLAPVLLHGTTACCFSGLWRVSTKNQLGLGSSAEEKCSAPNAPFSARLSDSQLEFDVPDSRLTELALCNVVQNSSFGELACVLQVSIVDTVFLLHVAVAVTLELRRGAALAFMPGAHTYVPLLAFHAEVQLAYMDAGRPVFLVVSDLAPLPDAGATEVGLASALERVDALPGVNCGRYTLNSDFQNTAQWTLDGGPARASVLLRADVATSDNLVLKLYYTLRLLEREGGAEDAASRNTMNVAVWRNVSLDHAVCETTPPPLTVRMGEVLTFSGLGAYAASTATALHEPTETVRGELGGLTTFVARALVAHVRRVHPASLLAAFTLPAAAPLLAGVLGNVTMLQGGRLDFTDSFRAACGTSEYCHLRYIYGRGVHYMSSCDDAAQDSARAWLRVALGVVHDAGHVEAACALAHAPSTAYAYEIVLVNTRAYMPRTAQWHALQNHSAPESISRLYMLFEFV
jgi:hypothetical protein